MSRFFSSVIQLAPKQQCDGTLWQLFAGIAAKVNFAWTPFLPTFFCDVRPALSPFDQWLGNRWSGIALLLRSFSSERESRTPRRSQFCRKRIIQLETNSVLSQSLFQFSLLSQEVALFDRPLVETTFYCNTSNDIHHLWKGFLPDLPSLWWVLLSRWPMAWRKRFSGFKPMFFVAKLDRVFVCGVFVSSRALFLYLIWEMIQLFAFAKKSIFF